MRDPSRQLQPPGGGFYPAGAGDEFRVDPKRVIHFDGNLLVAANHLRVNGIIVAVKERRGGAIPLRELLDCKMAGIKVLDLSSFFERVRGQVRIDSLRASWLIYGEGFRRGWGRTRWSNGCSTWWRPSCCWCWPRR